MAAASLGRLTLDLVAKIGSFIGPMDQAERKARDANKNIANSFDVASVAVKAFGAVVAGVSIASVGAFVDRTIAAGDEIQRFAKLANASVGQFQYYAKGAETAGMSLETFADKMKDMLDRIGDFQQSGGGPLADFFENIAPLVGVTIQQFQKLSGPEALQLFYDSLVKVGSTQNDITFYMEQIISDSALLIPLLENGGEGFKKWGDAAKNAGAIMSDSMVEQLALAKENLRMLDLQWQGLEATLVNNVAPIVQTVADNIDDIKAVALALGAAIATKLVVQLGILSYEFARGVVEGVRYQMTLARMAGQTITLTTATVGLKTALIGLVGGGGGLALLAVQAIAAGAAFLYMKNSSDNANQALVDQIDSVEELTKKYSELNSEQRQFEASKLREKIEEEAHSVELATNKYVALSMAKEGIWNTEQIDAFNKLIQDVSKNGVDTNTAFEAIKRTGLFSQNDLDKIAQLNAGFKEANDKLKQHQGLLESLESKNSDLAKSHDKVAASVNAQAKAYLSLTQKQREALKSMETTMQRERYIQANMQAGWSREKAEWFADYRNSAGLGYTGKPLSSTELKAVTQGFKSQNYTFKASDLKAIAKVNGIASANNFAQIEALYGLPKGTLAALVLQESGGNPNAVSPTGAKGLFQTTSVFRKQYGLSTSSSIEAQASAAAQDIAKNLKTFGSLEKALMAYNAGAGGLRSYLQGGLSDQKRQEVSNYVPGWAKWYAGVNGKTAVDQEIFAPSQETLLAQAASVEEALEALNDKKLEIESKYYPKSQALAVENQKAIDSINETFGGDPEKLKVVLAKQSDLYKSQIEELEISKKAEYQAYFDFETDRITQISQSYDKEKRLIQINAEYSKAQKKEIAEALERQKQQEIDAVRREEEQQVRSAFEAYLNETEIVVNRYKVERDEIQKNYQLTKETREKLLQANSMGIYGELNRASDQLYQHAGMSRDFVFQRTDPRAYAQWDLQNQYSSSFSGLSDDYNNLVSGINQIDDENERNDQLLKAHEQYLQARADLDAEYALRQKDLEQQQYNDTMNMYGALLSQAGSVWGDMTQLVKDSQGEQSSAYKAMFLMQQAFAIGSALVNTHLAAAQVMADPTALTLPQKMLYSNLILGMGYANVGMIAAQTIAGMAHDGIDNIPKEGTWLLDKGERVVDSRTNADLKQYLAGNKGNGPNVNIIVPPGYTAQHNTDSQGNVTIEVVRKEIAASWSNLANPNSHEMKQVRNYTTAGTKR